MSELTYSDEVWFAMCDILHESYGLEESDIIGRSRKYSVVKYRFIMMHLYKTYTKQPFVLVGERFRRDRSSIYHDMDRAEDLLAFDRPFQHDYRVFKEKLEERI